MPELPEVEVVKKSLDKKIKKLVINDVIILNKNLRYKIETKKFLKLKKTKIISIKRRSKYLLINLSNKLTILVHLGMTGKFFIIDQNKKKYKTSFYYSLSENDDKHDHLAIHFNKHIKLIYNDVRKFGFIKLLNSKELLNSSHLKYLGPEPLSKNFNLIYFINYVKKLKTSIKDLLMNQKFVSGLGNIYCNEVLFKSKINPRKTVNKLKRLDLINLIKNTKIILKNSISLGGSSIKDFSNADGKNGNFQQKFNVYGREKNNCLTKGCSGVIKKIYVSNRSTFFCSYCQK